MADKRDYYEVMGVPKNAAPQQPQDAQQGNPAGGPTGNVYDAEYKDVDDQK